MKKIKSVTLISYQSVDGYEERNYTDVEVPDNFEELDYRVQSDILMERDYDSSTFTVRKVFDSELEDVVVER